MALELSANIDRFIQHNLGVFNDYLVADLVACSAFLWNLNDFQY